MQLHPGAVVVYHLLPASNPTHPNKEWRGKIRSVYASDALLVESLEPGYLEESEVVYLRQVIRVEDSNNI